MERDVVIVGAGPAGSVTASALAQKGHDVLLLDRQQFPRDKTCGDAIPGAGLKIMQDLGMTNKIDHAIQQGHLYPVDSMGLTAPSGHTISIPFTPRPDGIKSVVAPRLHFDYLLQQHAIESGAEFQPTRVTEPIIEQGVVRGVVTQLNGTAKQVRARLVIAADGVTSAIARVLRPDEHQDLHRAVAIRAYITDIVEIPNQVEFFLYRDILPGYAWIFPTAEGKANIGLGMRLDLFRRRKLKLKQMFDDFLQIPAIKKRLKRGGELHDVASWQLNFGSQKHIQRAYDGALLVGDAAGLINPLTGGGIHNALVSAILAAEQADQALRQGDCSRSALAEYETACDTALWDSMKRAFLMQYWLLRFPLLVDWLIRRMGKNNQFTQMFLNKL